MAKRGVLEHPKTLVLADELGIMDCFALGIMEAFWHHVAKYHEDGDVTGLKPSVMARSIRYTGDAQALWDAMVAAGFLERTSDGHMAVHDWSHHCDDSVHAKLYRAVRLFADGTRPQPRSIGKEERLRLDPLWDAFETQQIEPNQGADISRTSNGHTADVLPLPKPKPLPKPLPTPEPVGGCKGEETGGTPQPAEPPQPPKGKGRVLSGNRPESMPEAQDYGAEIGLPNPQVERFCNFWDSRGWKGRTGAIVDWKAAMRTWKSKWLEEEADKAAKPKPKVKETVEQTYQRVQLELMRAAQ